LAYCFINLFVELSQVRLYVLIIIADKASPG